jgi:uncharacterized protein
VKNLFKFHKDPKAKEYDLLASWPGIGNVSLILAKYLKEKLHAEEIGTIDPIEFYNPIGVMVKNNIIEAPQFPESKFYCWHNPETDRGLLLFISDEQPSSKGYDLASCVLDVGKRFKLRRVFTCAAAIAKIHHTEMPHVWGAATNERLIEDIKDYDIILRGDIQIAGLNGLFLGVAKERGIDGVCLLGEVPMYTTRIPNPKAALAILKVMAEMLKIKIDMADLANIARQADEDMKKLAAEAMGEFITSYTKPVWPPSEEYDEGEGEEDDEEDDEEDETNEEN